MAIYLFSYIGVGGNTTGNGAEGAALCSESERLFDVVLMGHTSGYFSEA
jgi:hypothetical protein